MASTYTDIKIGGLLYCVCQPTKSLTKNQLQLNDLFSLTNFLDQDLHLNIW